MAPTTPQRPSKRKEWDTVTRVRFFEAFDTMDPNDSLNSVANRPEINVPPATARRWLKQRDTLGSPALRRTRRRSSILGRNSTVTESVLETITDQSNPIHEDSYQDQVNKLELPCAPYTLQHHATQAGARRFKKSYTSEISAANKTKRIQYGREHQDKGIIEFWQNVWFTDEVHLLSASLQNKPEYELRYPGQQRRKERLQEVKSSGLKVTVHVAAGVSYNHKGPLIFYNDPKEPSEKVIKPRKPVKYKYEMVEDFEKRLRQWEAQQPEATITPKGNAMSQDFYAKEVLPKHIKECQALQERYGQPVYLQEDGDPSHGNRSTHNPCFRLKTNSGLRILIHPPQSPDLNPIEACWQILKQRLRGGNWQTVAEFKEAIQREWKRITIAQIRRRIREMRWRCKQVQALNGGRVRSSLW